MTENHSQKVWGIGILPDSSHPPSGLYLVTANKLLTHDQTFSIAGAIRSALHSAL